MSAAEQLIDPRDAEIASLRAEKAELEARLARCNAAYVKVVAHSKAQAETIRQLRDRDRREAELFALPNTKVSAADKLVAWAMIDEWEHGLRVAGEDVPTVDQLAKDDAEPQKVVMYRSQITEKTGLSEATVSSSSKTITACGMAHHEVNTVPSKRTGLPVKQMSIAPSRQLLASPKALILPDDPVPFKHGGKRVACPKCGSDDVHEVKTHNCGNCGHEWNRQERPINEERDPAPEPFSLRLPQAEDSSRKSKLAPSCDPTPASDPDPASPDSPSPYVGQPWYEPDRPDNELSQALEWALYYDVQQATLWYGSPRLQERFRRGPAATILNLQPLGNLSAVQFIDWLRSSYEMGDYNKLRMVAQVCGIDPSRVRPLRLDYESEEGQDNGDSQE